MVLDWHLPRSTWLHGLTSLTVRLLTITREIINYILLHVDLYMLALVNCSVFLIRNVTFVFCFCFWSALGMLYWEMVVKWKEFQMKRVHLPDIGVLES